MLLLNPLSIRFTVHMSSSIWCCYNGYSVLWECHISGLVICATCTNKKHRSRMHHLLWINIHFVRFKMNSITFVCLTTRMTRLTGRGFVVVFPISFVHWIFKWTISCKKERILNTWCVNCCFFCAAPTNLIITVFVLQWLYNEIAFPSCNGRARGL